MTFTEMTNLMFDTYCGRRSDATTTLRTLFLNNTKNEMALAFFFDSLEVVSTSLNTVADTRSYAFPTNMIHIETIRDLDNGYALEEKSWEWFNANDVGLDDDDHSGPPEFWTISEGLIYFSPKPDDAYNYRIKGRRFPPDMGVLQDCTLPLDWHLIVVLLASADLLFALGNGVRAMELKNEALAKIASKQELRTLRRHQIGGQATSQRTKPS